MNHTFKNIKRKQFLKIIRNKMYSKGEENILRIQFGFRNALGILLQFIKISEFLMIRFKFPKAPYSLTIRYVISDVCLSFTFSTRSLSVVMSIFTELIILILFIFIFNPINFNVTTSSANRKWLRYKSLMFKPTCLTACFEHIL